MNVGNPKWADRQISDLDFITKKQAIYVPAHIHF